MANLGNTDVLEVRRFERCVISGPLPEDIKKCIPKVLCELVCVLNRASFFLSFALIAIGDITWSKFEQYPQFGSN